MIDAGLFFSGAVPLDKMEDTHRMIDAKRVAFAVKRVPSPESSADRGSTPVVQIMSDKK